MGRCFGRTKTLRRCRREGNWRFFCPDHFWPSVVYLGTAFITLISVVTNVYTIHRILRGPSKEVIELRREVYYQIDMACHGWKNVYFYLRPDLLKESEREYTHIWERLENEPAPPYSIEAYLHFKPLFENQANLLRNNLESLLTSNGDILPTQFRSLMMRTMKDIEYTQRIYNFLPTLDKVSKNLDSNFEKQFHDMVGHIAKLSYEADRLRSEE